MEQVRDCKIIEPFKCNEDDSVVDVAKRLREITLRHIFVVDSSEAPTGVISVIDINNRVVAESKNPQELKAKDIMSTPIDVADIKDSVEELSKKMIEKKHVMAPVVKDGKMMGIVTINQILKTLNKNGQN